ncbi:MAG: hypothetical protein AAF570_24510, partial [Bacteroidota bacterium]
KKELCLLFGDTCRTIQGLIKGHNIVVDIMLVLLTIHQLPPVLTFVVSRDEGTQNVMTQSVPI